MKAVLPALAVLAGLAGCTDAPAPANRSAEADPPLEDVDASLALAQSEPGEKGGDGGAAPRFVGRWAADERLCASAAWRFDAEGLETPAGSVCRFDEVREVPGGYDIAARCTAEAPERADTIRLRFAESAVGMTFEADVIADAGLVRCAERE